MPADALGILQDTVTKTATFTGTGLDLVGGTPRRGNKVRLLVGTVAGTSPTLDVKIQDSADNTTFADLAVFPRHTAAGLSHLTYETSKRYVRALATVGGTAPSFVYKVEGESGRP